MSKVNRNKCMGLMRAAISAVVLSILIASSSAYGKDHRAKGDAYVAKQLSHKGSGFVNVIVKLAGKPTASQLEELGNLGADIYRKLPVINSVALKIRRDRLNSLLGLPFVTHVSGDIKVRKNDAYTVSSSGADVAYRNYKLTGSSVGIAVVDSGVNQMSDFSNGLLSNRLKTQISFVPNSNGSDDCGHGTFVAGIAAGNASSSSGFLYTQSFMGIARKANVFSVKVLDSQGQGTVSQVVAGIQWCVQNAQANNIRVINLSLGHPVGESYQTDPLCQAVESAWKSGIVVVCAAGNSGRLNDVADPNNDNEGYGTNYGSINSPGNDPYVITVGAMKTVDGVRSHDRVTTYSSRGPSRLDFVLKPDLVAAGNQIVSVEAKGAYLERSFAATNQVAWSKYCLVSLGGNSDRYFQMSGTSMSAPVVAGAVALMLEKDKTLTPDTIKVRLMVGADKWLNAAGKSDPCAYGAGYLNIPNALQSTLVAKQSALSPQLGTDANGNVYVDPSNALWGNHAIWGTDTLLDLRAIWGNQAIWGNSSNVLDASHAIWGNGFWGDQTGAYITSSGVDLSAGSAAIQGER